MRAAQVARVARVGGPAAVEVGRVQVQRIVDEAQAVGSLRSRQSVVLRPEVSGRISKLPITDGQRVKKGQVLVQLDDTLQAAQLRQAQAQASIARSNLQRSRELQAQNFVSQSAVDQNAANLEVAEAQVALARAQLAAHEDHRALQRHVGHPPGERGRLCEGRCRHRDGGRQPVGVGGLPPGRAATWPGFARGNRWT